VRPLTLLVAKLAVWAAAALLSVAFVIAAVRLAFHVPVPAAAGWFILALVLGIASLFALGMLVAVVSPTARTATGLGMLLFFPNMFFAGVYFPTEEMSPTLRQIGNFTPLGAALHAVRDSVLVGAFTMLGQKTEEQNLARKQMITELAEASHRLEEMIAENTGLQAQLVT
jgi:ABC-2 type transport system permease protein